MTKISKEALSYAILLIILCSIAAIAAWETISYLSDKLSAHDFSVAALIIWSLTLGFMLIAGAFGLWTTNLAAKAESRRHISKLVETMNYILDGLIVINKKGIITGANEAACKLANTDILKNIHITSIFTCLSKTDIKKLTDRSALNEIECSMLLNNVYHIFRFRSQPSANLSLILISDVTILQEQKEHKRQEAQLQLIGEIAKGVANDFDTLLCSITANAAILSRFSPDTPQLQKPARDISNAADKGILLARKLNELAESSSPISSGRPPAMHIRTAAGNLLDILPDGWQLECNIGRLAPASLTGSKLEQVIINLGLIAADFLDTSGILTIDAQLLPEDAPQSLKERCSYTITVTAGQNNEEQSGAQHYNIPYDHKNPGVILSVIRSLILETGGSLEPVTGDNVQYGFRLCLAHSQISKETGNKTDVTEKFAEYIAGWSVLIASPSGSYDTLETILDNNQVCTYKTDNIISLLAQLEKQEYNLDILVFDDQLAKQEIEAILKTITKLHPDIGIIVLSETPDKRPYHTGRNITFVKENSSPGKIIMTMIDLAAKIQLPAAASSFTN